MAKRTPLFESHVALGARMVAFAGWDMPLQYGSQIEEHHAVRRSAGMFDVSHMASVDVGGPAAVPYLRRLLANDVARLARPGSSLYSCMLNDAGGVVDDLIVCRVAEGRYRLVLNAGTAEKDLAWMQRCRNGGGFDVRITPRHDLAMIAVQGPAARDAVWKVWPEIVPVTEPLARFHAAETERGLVSRTGYTGEDGFEITLPAEQATGFWERLLAAGVAPCGLGARDTLRLEAGMNLYGNDMDETTSPFESGLGWTVDLRSARDFVGRRAIEGVRVTRTRVALVLRDRGVLRAHMRLRSPLCEGETTSGSFSPTLGCSIALARVRRADGVQPLPGDIVEVEVRDKWLPARIVEAPFVAQGKSLIGENQ